MSVTDRARAGRDEELGVWTDSTENVSSVGAFKHR